MDSQACAACNQPVEPGDVQCSLCGRDLDTVGPETMPHGGGAAAAQQVGRSSAAPAILVGLIAIVAIAAIAGLTLLRSTPRGRAVTSSALRLGPSLGPGATTDSTSATTSEGATAGGTATSTGVPTTVVITGHECGRTGPGPYTAYAAGNDHTSCAFALSVWQAYVAAQAGGLTSTIQAFSPVTQRSYVMSCSGAEPVSCGGGNDALVYLYNGQASAG